MSLPEEERTEQPESGQETAASADTGDQHPGKGEETAGQGASPTDASGRISELEAEIQKYKDMAMRAEAEMQNMQRRTARDVENAHKYGIERFLQNLFPVVDSLEKAVETAEQASGDSGDAMAEGVRLCYKLMVDVLAKENVEILDPVGEPFNPQEHQAMSMVENPDMEPNSVCAVVQKGYKLNDRLVRAAMVMVTKAPESAAAAGPDEE